MQIQRDFAFLWGGLGEISQRGQSPSRPPFFLFFFATNLLGYYSGCMFSQVKSSQVSNSNSSQVNALRSQNNFRDWQERMSVLPVKIDRCAITKGFWVAVGLGCTPFSLPFGISVSFLGFWGLCPSLQSTKWYWWSLAWAS